MRTRLALGMALLAAGLGVAWAQEGRSRLEEATARFAQGDYSHAVVLLREIVLDTADSDEKAAAHFWLAKSYLAMDNLGDGERSLEFFLSNYPQHPDYPEAFYEKGRLLYRQQDYENAIQVLQAFLERYQDSEFVPNAYFWVGEALYSLGQLEDALLAYRKVVDSYPTSFKVEAARYRIAIIEFKKRENELLKLLKWSHEESLRTIEGFQRRETAYEQALAAYQRKLSVYEREDLQGSVSALQLALAERESEIEALDRKLAEYTSEIERLRTAEQTAAAAREAAVAAASQAASVAASSPAATATPAAPSPAAPASTSQAELERLRALLDLKARALELKESLLEWIASNGGSR